MREELSNSLKSAMKARDAQRISTIRLINATIKDRDIAVRSEDNVKGCLLYTSPSPRDATLSRMPSSA